MMQLLEPLRTATGWLLPVVVLAVLSIGGCSPSEARDTGVAESRAAGTVDSILPVEEALSRFQADLPQVTELTGGAESRDALVRRFLHAVEVQDTAALRSLVLTRAEYGWLYYPGSTFAREPFYQMPQLNWFLNVEDSQKGITRVVTRYGGTDLRSADYHCPQPARVDRQFTFWDRCLVAFQHEGVEKRMRLFGSIVELDGHFKFYSYANDL
jgi:hypothetical protein